MIPPPKLDDRSFNDIVEEAISMIPRYAPEWTNHNPSDPGITLIELAAWMTDLLIYRLNQVPDKNYVAFLNLLGIKLRAPRAAKALVRFAPRRGRDQAARAARHPGLDAAGDRGAHGHVRDRARRDGHRSRGPIAASPTSTRRTPRTVATSTRSPARSRTAFEVFDGAQRIERYLYLVAIRASRTPANRRCCGSSSARPSAAAATWRACSSGSTGTARAGRTCSPRRSRSIAARSRSSGRSASSRPR